MSHAHNPNAGNMNVGNMLGTRASVTQSRRFREQMQGSAVAAALISPVTSPMSTSRSGHSQTPSVGSLSASTHQPSSEPPVILTHRGGARAGGVVWQNDEYWQKRIAGKQARRLQLQQQTVAQGLSGGFDSSAEARARSGTFHGTNGRPSTFPDRTSQRIDLGLKLSGSDTARRRNDVPPLSLNLTGTSGRIGNRGWKPPLKKRGPDSYGNVSDLGFANPKPQP